MNLFKAPSRLNNQFIWLLSDLGVSDKTFLQLQQRWFRKKPSCSIYSELRNFFLFKVFNKNNESYSKGIFLLIIKFCDLRKTKSKSLFHTHQF